MVRSISHATGYRLDAFCDGLDVESPCDGDIHELALAPGLERVYVVGHDIGGLVAYASRAAIPDSAAGAIILDEALAGIAGWDRIEGHAAMWQVRFMQVPGLAEQLVAGRQTQYLGRTRDYRSWRGNRQQVHDTECHKAVEGHTGADLLVAGYARTSSLRRELNHHIRATAVCDCP